MAELTPERLRDAMGVLHQLSALANIHSDASWRPSHIENHAKAMERERDIAVRVEELAEELCGAGHEALGLSGWHQTGYKDGWREIASFLAERHPALLDKTN